MGKIIIDNRSDMDDAFAIGLCQRIVREGRVSNYGKQYAYLTTFHFSGADSSINVATDLNKCSDRFVVYNERI